MVFLFYRRNFKSMTNQLRFGIDIDGAGVLSIRKSNSKYSAANLQASFKEEAKEVRALDRLKIGCSPESWIFHLDQCFSHFKWSKYQYKPKL